MILKSNSFSLLLEHILVSNILVKQNSYLVKLINVYYEIATNLTLPEPACLYSNYEYKHAVGMH